jgi:TPR repeat protein
MIWKTTYGHTPPPPSHHSRSPPPQLPQPKTAAAISTSFTLPGILWRIASQNMSRRASKGVKRLRQQQGREEHAEPAPLHLTALATLPLPLLSVAQSFFRMCVSAQLCNMQGASLFPFVRLPPRAPRPFAGAPVHNMSLTHGERLRLVGCGLKGKLVRRLSLGTDCYFEPCRNRCACHKLMYLKVGRVAASLTHSLAAAAGNKAGEEAEELCASGQCAAAAVALKLAVDLGHLPSRALMAHMLIDGREGVAQDCNRAFELVEQGARLGCHHCQGVLAFCCLDGLGCEVDKERSLELARESSRHGSRYGQCTLGDLYEDEDGAGGIVRDRAQAIALYRLAAAQNFDDAQYRLGGFYGYGIGVDQNHVEALRLLQLAAAQGHRLAMFLIAALYEYGEGTRKNKAAAIRWYKHAQAAGHPNAAFALLRLRA